MPNLIQVQSLREAYFYGKGKARNLQPNRLKTDYLNFFTDSRYLNLSYERKRQFFFNISGGYDEEIIRYLEGRQKANVVLLFIDITDFSKKCENKTNEQISAYLDDYYDKVIPIIYEYGGEVDKIIGDGIICLFGEPFLPKSMHKFDSADKCAKEVIFKLKDTDKAVKVALHDGEILYYCNKALSVPDYTIIGKMITELFRLEGVSDNNAINYYSGVYYDTTYNNETAISIKGILTRWLASKDIKVDLKGVSYQYRKYLQGYSI